jgi:Zn-finger nucleic acid-binding protein
MDCPRCKLMLRETQYEGVTADICDNCWGIWLDRGELEEVLDSRAMQFSDAERKQITSIRGESALPRESEPAACPKCGRIMDVVHSDAGVQITLDRCPEHGVWLDPGEIKAVQAVAEKSAELHRLLIQKLGLGGA